MTNPDETQPNAPGHHDWAGLKELDKALAEGRLTEYRIKKAWADPINRAVTLVVLLILLAYVVYVVVNDFVL